MTGYLRTLRGRLLSSEKLSEVFTLCVFTLKPLPCLLSLFGRLNASSGPFSGCVRVSVSLSVNSPALILSKNSGVFLAKIG